MATYGRFKRLQKYCGDTPAYPVEYKPSDEFYNIDYYDSLSECENTMDDIDYSNTKYLSFLIHWNTKIQSYTDHVDNTGYNRKPHKTIDCTINECYFGKALYDMKNISDYEVYTNVLGNDVKKFIYTGNFQNAYPSVGILPIVTSVIDKFVLTSPLVTNCFNLKVMNHASALRTQNYNNFLITFDQAYVDISQLRFRDNKIITDTYDYILSGTIDELYLNNNFDIDSCVNSENEPQSFGFFHYYPPYSKTITYEEDVKTFTFPIKCKNVKKIDGLVHIATNAKQYSTSGTVYDSNKPAYEKVIFNFPELTLENCEDVGTLISASINGTSYLGGDHGLFSTCDSSTTEINLPKLNLSNVKKISNIWSMPSKSDECYMMCYRKNGHLKNMKQILDWIKQTENLEECYCFATYEACVNTRLDPDSEVSFDITIPNKWSKLKKIDTLMEISPISNLSLPNFTGDSLVYAKNLLYGYNYDYDGILNVSLPVFTGKNIENVDYKIIDLHHYGAGINLQMPNFTLENATLDNKNSNIIILYNSETLNLPKFNPKSLKISNNNRSIITLSTSTGNAKVNLESFNTDMSTFNLSNLLHISKTQFAPEMKGYNFDINLKGFEGKNVKTISLDFDYLDLSYYTLTVSLDLSSFEPSESYTLDNINNKPKNVKFKQIKCKQSFKDEFEKRINPDVIVENWIIV